MLLVLLAGVGQASANPAMEWIEKMADSMRNLSYKGNFVYLHENQLESMSILHIKDDSGEKERLLSLNGQYIVTIKISPVFGRTAEKS